MKRHLKIASFFLLALLLTAEKCGNSGSTVVAREDVFQTIENEFTSDDFNIELRTAFEKRSVQKLKDLVEYINISADTSYSPEFRSQALIMIEDAFETNEDCEIFYTDLGFQEDPNKRLLKTADGIRFVLEIDSAEITREFSPVSPAVFEGEISFVLSMRQSLSAGKLSIVARKTPKQFGGNTLQVWELYIKL